MRAETGVGLVPSFSGGEDGEAVLSLLALEQLATHIPDMVLYRSHQAPVPQIVHCYGVIMFLDVSGTAVNLCMNYCYS